MTQFQGWHIINCITNALPRLQGKWRSRQNLVEVHKVLLSNLDLNPDYSPVWVTKEGIDTLDCRSTVHVHS